MTDDETRQALARTILAILGPQLELPVKQSARIDKLARLYNQICRRLDTDSCQPMTRMSARALAVARKIDRELNPG